MGRLYSGLGIRESIPSSRREGSACMGAFPRAGRMDKGWRQGHRGSIDQGLEGQDEHLGCVLLDTSLQ